MEYERHDAIFGEVLRDKRSMCGFLESVFGFLSRNTDFYYIMRTEHDTMGLPKGYKERLVFKILKKFEISDTTIQSTSEYNFGKTHLSAPEEVKISKDETVQNSKVNLVHSNSNNNSSTENLGVDQTSTILKINKFNSNEYYNGAAYEMYCWSQSATDIEVHINLPNHITSAKQLTIKIDADHISITEKINNKIIVDGNFTKKCKHNEAVWSLSGGKLQIILDKVQETWWNQFLDNEPLIDLSKMDCTRTIDEFSAEAQAVIEKLKWDQHQQMLGLPTSEEIKNQEMLRKAWDAEGSPFKGQPFDPSLVKFK